MRKFDKNYTLRFGNPFQQAVHDETKAVMVGTIYNKDDDETRAVILDGDKERCLKVNFNASTEPYIRLNNKHVYLKDFEEAYLS